MASVQRLHPLHCSQLFANIISLDQYKRRFRRWKVQKSHGVISWPSGSMSSPSVVEAPSPWSRASNKTVTLPEDTDRVHSTPSIELSVPSTSSPYGPPSVFFEEREPVLDGKEDPSRSLNVNDTESTFPNQWSVKELESKAVLGARTSTNSNKSASESPTTLPSQLPEVTLTTSIGSSSRSWASFERVGDRLQETTRLSASPPEVGISAIDEEVEALSDELGIFSINSTEYEGQDDDWTILWTENPY